MKSLGERLRTLKAIRELEPNCPQLAWHVRVWGPKQT